MDFSQLKEYLKLVEMKQVKKQINPQVQQGHTNNKKGRKTRIKFAKISIGVNIRLARQSTGCLSLGFIAHYTHSKHVSWIFWVMPTPPSTPSTLLYQHSLFTISFHHSLPVTLCLAPLTVQLPLPPYCNRLFFLNFISSTLKVKKKNYKNTSKKAMVW